MSKRTKIVLAVVVVLVLASVVAFSVTKESRKRIGVQTEKVARRDLLSVVTASGEVKPKRFVNISANVSGRITQLSVKEGETVRKGQVLARIDSTRFEAETRQSQKAVEASRQELQRAEADLEATRLSFERTKRMHEGRLVSDEAFDQAQAEMKIKKANVEAQRQRIAQGEAFLQSNQDTLDKTILLSPMEGVVTSLQKEEGEVVIGAQSFQPTVVMTVADLSVMEAEVLVDETDIRNVKLGQEAEVRVDALEGIKIKGEVTEIGSSAIPRGATVAGQQSVSTANQAKDFKVVVTLKDPPANLRPGLNATVDITTARKAGVLAVPIQAVVVREVDPKGKVVDPGSLQASEEDPANAPRPKVEEKEGAFVLSKGLVRFRPVKTGILGEREIEIIEGLSEGDEIVTGSYKTLRTLKDEAKVKIEKKKEQS